MPEPGVSVLEGDLRRRGARDEPDELEDLRSSDSDRLRSSDGDLNARHPRPTRSASASPRPVRAAVAAAPPTDGVATRDRARQTAARDRARQTAPPRQTAPARSAQVPKGRVEGRRTVTIHGHGAERYYPARSRRRPASRPYERPGFRPDRVAMWAVLLGFVLVLVAAATSHAAMLLH
jgi:hypothetical protein